MHELPRIPWPQYFLDRVGGELPVDYVTFDTETTGFSPTDDLILSWGHVLVRNRVPVARLSFLINWFEGGLVPHDEIRFLLKKVRRYMSFADKEIGIDEERLRTEGVSPLKCLPEMHRQLCKWMSDELLLVGHNAVNYDYRMLQGMFTDFSVGDFRLHKDALFDTGSVVKSLALLHDRTYMPKLGESLVDYSKRLIYKHAPGVKWGLDGPEVAKFDLVKYGVDRTKFHTADNDALAVHGIFETFRDLIDVVGVKPAVNKRAQSEKTKQKVRQSKIEKSGKRRKRQRNR